jgi:rare lipoprotein A
MPNWNLSYTLSTSVVALTIISSLASHSVQAQIGSQSEAQSANVSTPLSNSLKVGETRSQSLTKTKDYAIASIHTHKLNGKNAATVYVRGIPVVTYIESEESSENAQSDSSSLSKPKSETKGETKKNSESVKLPSTSVNNLQPSRQMRAPRIYYLR